jgi:hypothetical protein
MVGNMPRPNPTDKQGVVVTIGSRVLIVLFVALGLLLLVIGASIGQKNVLRAGLFIFPAALMLGGLLAGEEKLAVRVSLISIGGIFVIYAFALSSAATSLIPGIR